MVMVVIPSCCAAQLRCTRIASESLLSGQQSWPVPPVWGMRIDIVSVMSSISAFLTDLKRIQTPHSLFWGFRADKTFTTRWSGGRVQV